MNRLFSILLPALLLPGFAPAETKKDFTSIVDIVGKREVEERGGIGITIGVAHGDETVYLKGFGKADLENDVPASENGVYRIGSITKMFTAAAILLLLEEGKLTLDDPLQKHLPEYPDMAKGVTLRHLLNHTSGIFSFTDIKNRWSDIRLDLKHEEILEKFQDVPLAFKPGEKFKYSNSGYYLLGMVIEKVSGRKYHEFLEEQIFQKIDLKATSYDRHLKIIPHRVRGYAKWGDQIVNAQFVSMKQPFAAGAIASTAGDLIQWQRALVAGSLLKPETYQLMITPAKLAKGKSAPYALGCFVGKLDETAVIRHGGAIPGFVSELAYFPGENLTVVVLTNATRNSPRSIADAIARTWIAKKKEK